MPGGATTVAPRTLLRLVDEDAPRTRRLAWRKRHVPDSLQCRDETRQL
jgi:hypothetical protein